MVSLQLSWPGLQSLAERSQLGSFAAVNGQALTGNNETVAYSLTGALNGGQVAVMTFTGTITRASKGSEVTLVTEGASDAGPVLGDTTSFGVPVTCGCDMVYNYTFNAPPCIGRRLLYAIASHLLHEYFPRVSTTLGALCVQLVAVHSAWT